MSLFHVHEWLGFEIQDANVFAVGKLLDDKDQVVVGSASGRIWVLDPGRVSDSKHQLCALLEHAVTEPVLHIAIAKFLSSYDQNLIAVLFPQSLAIFRLVAEGDTHRLVSVHEHPTTGVAYNMCVGCFGRMNGVQICVQSLNCGLSVFEAEHQLFSRNVSLGLHPGPMTYAVQSDSIITASAGLLSSIKFSNLAAASSSVHGKKISAEWTFDLGDWPVDVAVIDVPPVQPSIVVLCKRNLMCFTQGGTMRFSLRLQCVATTLLVYNSTSDAYIQLCIGTTTRTLLFYADNVLTWAAQLSVVPIQLTLCSFGAPYRSMLAILSSMNFAVSYLGTEPSLFRLPASQTRFIDFSERQSEFNRLEAMIRKKPSDSISGTGGVNAKAALKLTCNFNGLDKKSMAEGVQQEVPSVTVEVVLSCDRLIHDVRLVCRTQFYAERKYFPIASIRETHSETITFFAKTHPITDLRCQFYAFSAASSETTSVMIKFPLSLMCRAVSARRNALHKLTLESSEDTLEIQKVLPEFETDSGTSVGLEGMLTNNVVSIFIAPKLKRYRIQSDSLDVLYLFTEEVVARVKSQQPTVSFSCQLPIEQILHKLQTFVELEKRVETEEKELAQSTAQLRAVEVTALAKLKAQRPADLVHVDLLMEKTNGQVMSSIESFLRAEEALRAAAISLSMALNLLQCLASLNGIYLPIDGYIVDCSSQMVSERLKWILSTLTRVDPKADVSVNELKNAIRQLCEKAAPRMANIDEESEEDAEPEPLADENFNTLVSGSLPFTQHTE